MNRLERVCFELNTAVDISASVEKYGMDRQSARAIISMEGAGALPYPENAYSKKPGITFREGSLESIGRIVLQKIASAVDLVITIVSRIFKYIMTFLKGDYKKHFKEQKKHHEYASKRYVKAKQTFKEQPQTEKKLVLEDVLRRNATERLTDSSARLNTAYSKLIRTIHKEKDEFTKLIVTPHDVKVINDATRDVIDTVNTTIGKFAAGKVHSISVATQEAYNQRSVTSFLGTTGSINERLGSARLSTITLPPFNNTQEELINPHLYMRECLSVVRNASLEESGFNYVEDILDKEGSAVPIVDSVAVNLELLFDRDDIFKRHKEFEKAKKELLKAKRTLERNGIMPSETERFRQAMLTYLQIVTTTVNYSILFRQVNKVTVRSILRFINASTAYMTARVNTMNGL
jgi:hypothetical protein